MAQCTRENLFPQLHGSTQGAQWIQQLKSFQAHHSPRESLLGTPPSFAILVVQFNCSRFRADLCPQVVPREARLISLLAVGAEVQED